MTKLEELMSKSKLPRSVCEALLLVDLESPTAKAIRENLVSPRQRKQMDSVDLRVEDVLDESYSKVEWEEFVKDMLADWNEQLGMKIFKEAY